MITACIWYASLLVAGKKLKEACAAHALRDSQAIVTRPINLARARESYRSCLVRFSTTFLCRIWTSPVADPVGFDEVRSNPPTPFLVLVRWRPFTTSLAVFSAIRRLNIGPIIHSLFSKRIGRYPVVSVDQVRFCGELLFFFLIFFFLFFSLPFFKSWDGFSPWKSPLFYLSFFFFLPFFPPSFALLFFPPFLLYSNFFLPLSPCLPPLFYSFPIPFLWNVFFFTSTSVNIHHNSSQINVIN